MSRTTEFSTGEDPFAHVPEHPRDYRRQPMAGHGKRLIAALIDRVPFYWLSDWIGTGIITQVLFVLYVLNMGLLQGYTGASLGKMVVRIQLIADWQNRRGEIRPVYPGVFRCTIRALLDPLNALLLIGYLRPLWHHERQTWTDSICATHAMEPFPSGLNRREEFQPGKVIRK